jgi:hypothetical protein
MGRSIAMKTHRTELCASLFVFAFFPTVTQAQNVFRLYAGVAPTTYKISFDANAPDVGSPAIATYKNNTAKSSYTAANIGMTWASPKGIYVDLAASQSLSATHDLWNSVPNTPPQDFSHDSYTLTGGYSHGFASGVSVSGFGGYLVSNTTLNAPKPPFGFSKDKFDSQGVFIGVGGGIPALRGQFSASVALALMSGKWRDDSGSYNNHADYTVGFSLGGGYTYKFSQAWGITADVRSQQYKYTFGAYTATTAQPQYSVKENITSLGVKVSYQF